MCQSHTGRLTGFWFLLNRPKGWILMNEWIHFLNIASERWRPLLSKHSPSVSGSSASLVAAWREKLLPLLPWSVSNPSFSLVSIRTPCSWDIPRGRSIATRDTRSDEYWSADEISTESRRQNRCFWKSSPQQKLSALQTLAPWQLKCFEFR